MGRAFRWLTYLAAAFSAALCLGVLALWIPSHRHWWYGERESFRGSTLFELSVRSSDGALEFRRSYTYLNGGETFGPRAVYWNQRWSPLPQPVDWSKIEPGVIGIISDEMLWRMDFDYEPVKSFRWGQFYGYVGKSIDPQVHGIQIWSLTVPHWSLAALAAVLPVAVCAGLTRRMWRRLKGLCINCGYDLRASPERCPECGTVRKGPTHPKSPLDCSDRFDPHPALSLRGRGRRSAA